MILNTLSKNLRAVVAVAAASGLVGLLAPPQLRAQSAPSLVANRLTQRIDENSRVTLKGTVSPFANAANDRGPAPDSMTLDRIQVVLQRSAAQQAALNRLIQEQNTPGSSNYHKWLTPAQFGASFGPSDQDVATLESWLASKGFNIGKLNAGKQTLEVSGSVAQFRNAFHAQIDKYQVNGETHFANATNPDIPAALAPVFGGFASLNNFRPRPLNKVLGHAIYNPRTGQATPQWNYATNNHVFAPADFAVQYDLPPAVAGSDGTGETIAIVNESNINISLVNQFRSMFNLPPNPPNVIVDGNDPGVDGVNNPDGLNYASTEAYLDVEWAGAVAPKATIDLVIGADTALESGLVLAAEHAIYGDVAPILSLSFGLCEQQLGSSNAFINDLWEQAAAEGITVIVSTGDSGSAGCDNENTEEYATQGIAVSGFASTPYNVAVGGTDFYYSDYASGGASVANYWSAGSSQTPLVSLLKPIPEQPWNDSQYGLNLLNYYTQYSQTTIVGGSGGASSCATGTAEPNTGSFTACTAGYAKPAWQTGTGVPADKVRDIPDVSLFAAAGSNESYYPICAGDGDCQPASGSNLIQITGVGGTSASAPAFAGIMALVDEKYGPQGQADTVLYPLAAQFPASFHDVTNGSNAMPCSYSSSATSNSPNCISVSNAITITDSNTGQSVLEGALGTGTTADYNATAGYDQATGLGTIDATQLINNWGSVKFTASAVTLTSPTAGANFTHGSPITFTGSVTGSTPTGDVAIETDSTEPGQQGQGESALLSGNVGVFTLTAGGAFTGTLSTLPGGTYNVWANYGGDATNHSGQSTPFQITVSPENSGIAFNAFTPGSNGQYAALASGSNNVAYGSQIILSSIVAPSSQVSAYQQCLSPSGPACPSFTPATGSVTFSDGASAIDTAQINTEGEAEYAPPTAFGVGTHSVTASYSGDNSYSASTASAVNFTVVKANPNVLITGATDQQGQIVLVQGQSVTLTLLVEGNGFGIAPTGSVSITGGPTGTPTTATLSSTVDPFYGTTAGVATITIPIAAPTSAALAPQHRNGLPGWLAGGGTALACVLLVGIPSRRKSWRGMMGLIVLTLFALSVSIGCGGGGGGNSGGGGFGGGGTGGSGGSGGTTTGNYTITVNYAGDANYSSASGSATVTVVAAPSLLTSTTSFTATGTSPTETAALGVTVTVKGTSGNAAPTGTVVLYTGSLSSTSSSQGGAVEITQGNLSAGSGSTATVSFSLNSESLLQGSNLLTVLYYGDSNYAPSWATNTLNLTNPLSDFSMVPTNSNVSLTGSTSGTDTLNLTSDNGFSGTVNLTCAPPPGITTLTCSLNPASVSLTGTGNSATSTLTINSSGATAGNYQFNITGTSGTTVHTMAVTAAVR